MAPYVTYRLDGDTACHPCQLVCTAGTPKSGSTGVEIKARGKIIAETGDPALAAHLQTKAMGALLSS
jgi:hypothetical protein